MTWFPFPRSRRSDPAPQIPQAASEGPGRSEWETLVDALFDSLHLPQLVEALTRWLERHPRIARLFGGTR